MDEGGTGKEDNGAAIALGIVIALGVMVAAYAGMQREYRRQRRHAWMFRGFVLFNLACAMSQLAGCEQHPCLLLLTPFSLYCVWHDFRVSELHAGAARHMAAQLVAAREQIKTAEKGLGNES